MSFNKENEELYGSIKPKEITNKIKEKVNIPCIYEGGIGKLEDIAICIQSGIESLAIGTIIIFSELVPSRVNKEFPQHFLLEAKLSVLK